MLDQMRIQEDLAYVLDGAAAQTGLNRATWHRQVAGDGELAFLPVDTDGLRLIATYPNKIAQVLGQLNRYRTPLPRIRVRLAMDHGTLMPGSFGPVGQAPITVRRLLDSQILRNELLDTEADLVLIVSPTIYDGIVKTQLGGLEPSLYHLVKVRAKNVNYDGYIYRGLFGIEEIVVQRSVWLRFRRTASRDSRIVEP
ncbi:hypothetical protein K8Z49_01430 [Actinomadura madurae]|uniref:hypothetical protein n=1 Tax=Actinomadura madurae TaxID=1993 RepID=UPI0039996676